MPGVAVLGVVAIAALVILMVLAVQPLQRVLVGILSLIPFGIGAWVVTRQVDLVAAVYNALAGWTGASAGPFRDLIYRVAYYQWSLWDHAGALAERTYAMGQAIVGYSIPRQVGQAIVYSLALFGRAVAYTDARIAQVVQYAQQLEAQAIAYSLALFTQALAYVDSRIAQVVQYAQQLAAQGLQYAQAIGARDIAYAEAIGARDVAYAQQLAAQGLGFTRDAVGRAIDYERLLYGEAIRYAGQLAAQEGDYARQLAEAANAYTAAAVGAVAAAVTTIEDSPCQRFCGPLGDLGSMLQGLEDLGLAALLVGLAAEAVHDPPGTAREVLGLVAGPVQAAADLLGQEIGLGAKA